MSAGLTPTSCARVWGDPERGWAGARGSTPHPQARRAAAARRLHPGLSPPPARPPPPAPLPRRRALRPPPLLRPPARPPPALPGSLPVSLKCHRGAPGIAASKSRPTTQQRGHRSGAARARREPAPPGRLSRAREARPPPGAALRRACPRAGRGARGPRWRRGRGGRGAHGPERAARAPARPARARAPRSGARPHCPGSPAGRMPALRPPGPLIPCCLRTFARAVPSAWSSLPASSHGYFLSVLQASAQLSWTSKTQGLHYTFPVHLPCFLTNVYCGCYQRIIYIMIRFLSNTPMEP
ncbi:basic proline-rich protein-like [Choloepus didactylus]|uniref:basic proline-rich protein-like n=1 Tax=Choloepus didactylus TaxID=27675 RepID=UPI00189F35D4|nr:basic proline-rich protein-like [Choloepus didactylus]